jgi:hypothetical protein
LADRGGERKEKKGETEPSVQDLEIPPVGRVAGSQEPAQGSSRPSLAPDDLAEVLLGNPQIERLSATFFVLIDLDALRLIDKERDDVAKIVLYRHDQAADFS